MSRPPKPTALAAKLDNIPADLRAIPRWVCWRYMWHLKRLKWIKAPINPHDLTKKAAVDNPATWADFELARGAYEMLGGVDGVGFIFTGDGVVGMDFDKCLDTATGMLSDTAREAVTRIGGFWELSPSGNGLHCITLASIEKSRKDDSKGLELYDRGRYFTITGHVFDGMDDMPSGPQDLSWFVEKHFPAKPAAKPVRSGFANSERTAIADDTPPVVDYFRAVNDAALRNLSAWIPTLFPEAVESSKGYRITSAALGRDLEEDISAVPEGIHDFGVGDQGDEREGRRTPIDLVQEWYAEQLAGGNVLESPDVATAAHWLCEQMQIDPKTLGWNPPARLADPRTAELNFDTDEDGSPLATVGNVLVALRNRDYIGARVGLDSFRDEIMVSELTRDAWRPFTDADYTRLRYALELKGFRAVGRELIRDVVLLVAEEEKFDSAITWLSGQVCDGVPRCERFLVDYMGAPDTPYTRAASLYLWTALAGRVMKPGCKADMALILVGAQGVGKSSAVAALAPSPEMFAEISLVDRDDDLARKMRGRLVGEIGELRGLHSRDMEAVKSFITRTHEDWTPKYREFNQVYARRLVFIGTTNQEEFLADETGNRRWLPVRVGQIQLDRIRADLLALWAEARELFAVHGVHFWDAEKLAGEVQKQHTLTDVWEEQIRAWLDGAEDDDLAGDGPLRRARPIRVSEILEGALGFNLARVGRREEMRVARICSYLGYLRQRRRIAGSQIWVWLHPDCEALGDALLLPVPTAAPTSTGQGGGT